LKPLGVPAPHDPYGPAEKIRDGSGSEVTTVPALIPVVAHYEDLAFGNDYRTPGTSGTRKPGYETDGMRIAVQPFSSEEYLFPGSVSQARKEMYGLNQPVDEENIVPDLNGVARQADESLDEWDGFSIGIPDDDDVPAIRLSRGEEANAREGHANLISGLEHKDAVAFENGRLHRARGHDIPVRKDRSAGQDEPGDQEELTDVSEEDLALR